MSRSTKERVATKCVCCQSNTLASTPAILMPFVSHRALGYAPLAIREEWGLRTIPTGTAYQICMSLQCQTCEHLFLDLRFSDNEMERLYHDYRGKEYTDLRDHYEPGYRDQNSKLNEGSGHIAQVEMFLSHLLPSHPVILDWGGDTGLNTPFKKTAKSIFIYDISQKPTDPNISSISQSALREHHYDLIICSHVLEHIPYPIDLLTEITSVMTSETVLYIEVPFERLMHEPADRIHRHRNKHHWHEHINFYSEKSLRSLLAQCGLNLIDLETRPIASATNTTTIFQLACALTNGSRP